jgi:hypothetical protein
MYDKVSESDREIIEALARWHEGDWGQAEEAWRMYVKEISTAREMAGLSPAKVLRRAEAIALDLIGTLRLSGAQCPHCGSVFSLQLSGSGDGER